MGLHHESTHGRVFRGLEAKNNLALQKRNSRTTGDKIKWNVPKHMKAAARPADPAQLDYLNKDVVKPAARPADKAQLNYANKDLVTSTAIVYETLSADFTGAIAGYTTLTDVTATPTNVVQSGATASAASSTAQPANADESAYASAKSAGRAPVSTSSGTVISTSVISVSPTSSSIVTTTQTTDDGSNNKSNFLNPGVATTTSATLGAAAVVSTPLSATRGAAVAAGTPISATRTPQISQDSTGMTAGAKAGLAIGLIIAFALAGGLLFFCWRRRKNPNAHQELADEKRGSFASSIFGGRGMSEKHASVASEKVPASLRSARTASTAPRLSLRPVTQFLPTLGSDKNASNNLDANAAMSEKPKSMWERRAQTSENPFDDSNEKQARPETPENPFDEPEGKEKSPSNHSKSSSWEGSEPPTPKSAKLGTASAVAVAAAGTANAVPPMPRGANNVHRVQLDFKPSMDDELELKSGQLVRMLHEYDDGWALCMRMDRSQQGVTPRTCLSKLPVKPRPQGPPPARPDGRPMTPTGPPGMMPRPLTPTGAGRERSGSNAGIERPASPTGVPARKPVPGQAI